MNLLVRTICWIGILACVVLAYEWLSPIWRDGDSSAEVYVAVSAMWLVLAGVLFAVSRRF